MKNLNMKTLLRFKKMIIIFGMVIFLYALFGFFVVPAILKPRLQSTLSETLERKVSIDEVKVNPFSLSLTLNGFKILDVTDQPFFKFQHLYLNFEAYAFWRRALSFKEVHLIAPETDLRRLPDKTFNIDGLFTKSDRPGSEVEEKGGILPLYIANFHVDQGEFRLHDLSQPEPVLYNLGTFEFSLLNFYTYRHEKGPYSISFKGPKGGTLKWHGEVELKPFRLQGRYDISNISLPELHRFLQQQVPFALNRGVLNLSGKFLIEERDQKLHLEIRQGDLQLKDIQMTKKGNTANLISVPSLNIRGVGVDFGRRMMNIQTILSEDAKIVGWRTEGGIFNYESLWPGHLFAADEEQRSSGAAQPDKDGPPWKLTIRDLTLENYAIAFEDRSMDRPLQVNLSPVRFTLKDFNTQSQGDATYILGAEGDQGERLQANGTMALNPIRCQGRMSLAGINLPKVWESVQDRLPLQISTGTAGIAARYAFSLEGDHPQIAVKDGELQLNEFQLMEKGGQKVLVSVPGFTVKRVDLDLRQRQLAVGLVESSEGAAEIWLDEEGRFNFMKWLPESTTENEDKALEESADVSVTHRTPWQVALNEIRLDNYTLHFEDRALEKPQRVTVKPINVKIRNISNQKDAKSDISLFMMGEEGGTIQIDSKQTFEPFTAEMDLTVDRLLLRRFQPYIDPVARLEVTEGTFSLEGTLTVPEKSGHLPALRYQGGFTIEGVKTSDRRTEEDFFQWETFESEGVTFDVAPNRLHVREVTLKNPSARIVVNPEGETNAVDIFSPTKKGKTAESENLLEQLVDVIIAQIQGPVPLTLEVARLEDLSLSFIDQSIKPPYSAQLLISEAAVNGLSSGSRDLADVSVKGQIDRYASLQGQARMNPFIKEDPEAEITLSLKNFDLRSVTPYSGKYVGYDIDQGKLNLDANYHLKEEFIAGENKFLIKKFVLGQPVESPDAVDLPIPLAVALLKDRKGNIKFDLKVKGNTSDPDFDPGITVMDAVSEMVLRLVTSPFTALGGIFAEEEDEFDHIPFEFGSAHLHLEAQETLDLLANGLAEHPAIKLEIMGMADLTMDRRALAEADLSAQLKKMRLEELTSTGKTTPGSLEEIVLSDDAYDRLIIKAYKKRFGAEPSPSTKKEGEALGHEVTVRKEISSLETAKRSLIDAMPVDSSRLNQLAEQRASAIRTHLIDGGSVSSDRLIVLEPGIKEAWPEEGARALLSLTGE